MSKIKVLHVLASNSFSGAENVVCQIINMFAGDSYEMTYCSRDGKIRSALEERNIRYLPICQMRPSEIRRIIKEYKPNIIHAHDMKASFIVAIAGGNIPMISHIHNNAYDSRGISAKSIAYYFAAKKAKSIIWVSQSALDGYVFHKSLLNKSVVLYNVINQMKLYECMNLDSNDYDYDVVYVGRITYPKNPHRLLRIIRLVCDRLPELKVAIVGNGELDDEITALCSELKLDDNVSFLGFQRNPLKIMYDSKVMIMTSRWEGMPMVALEAIALGVPIISTPTDGMNELIENGINGYLTDDDNTFSELIERIVTDDSVRNRLSKAQLEKSIIINNIESYKSKLEYLYEYNI